MSSTQNTTAATTITNSENDQSMSSAQSAASSSPSSSMSNSKANLIINYLPQTMTDESFRVMFAKYGDIRSARIIRNKNSGYSYGFGFVEYFRQEDAEMAIKNLNGIVMNNKKMKVSYARPSSDDIKNANIYVTNLPSTFTENDVRELFAECGDIIQCRLIGNRSGTAFVLFNLNEQARQAIDQFDRKLVPGTNCRMKVKFATNEPNKKMTIKDDNNDFSENNNNINLTPPTAKHQKRYHNQSNNNNLFNNSANQRLSSGPMRNTSHHNRYNPLAQFHVQQAPMVDDPSMLYSDRNHHHHHSSHHHNPYGTMKMVGDSSQYFATSNADLFATAGNGGSYDGNQLDPTNSGSGSSSGGLNEYILFVYNIGPETDEYNLGKLFSYYGQVLRVNVIRKGGPQNAGEGKGYGFVTMKFYQEALNAIANLNGYKFVSNRPLQVSFKKI
ncbi:RNA binding [Dermatophagoides pteronyssinus]|uniref:RNA binding n=1 Tax=Dermatophagoides pteronyssinus TaxID=6956 RepID=A0ABQ8JKK2_DERPT|nr:RNA binding [Dermatophagoides pteronyssinus]